MGVEIMNMEQYHNRRNFLLAQISNYYNTTIDKIICHNSYYNATTDKIICHNCFLCDNLQIHHVYFNGNSHNLGGTRQLIHLEKDWEEFINGNEEKRLIVLCKNCHINVHYYHLKENTGDD